MVNQTSIKPTAWSKTVSKRLWRGNGSGKWTFSGKGCKGQNARKWSKFSPSFEWGQSPLFIRMPKMRWFTAKNQVEFTAVNLSTLEKIAASWTSEITKEVLILKWIIKKIETPVKILADWELKSKITVSADKASKKAIELVEKAWGKIELA